MSVYAPSSWFTLLVVSSSVAIVLLGGHALSRSSAFKIARALSWATLLFGSFALERWTVNEASGFRMLVLITFALAVLKVLVVVEERARGMPALTLGSWLGFASGWLGMNPRLFTRASRRAPLGPWSPLSPWSPSNPWKACSAWRVMLRGGLYAALGIGLIGLSRTAWETTHSRLLSSIMLLLALSCLLHFGLCNLLTGAWRLYGVATEPLFRAPLLAQNLSEFWARRWNVGFSEMTAALVYRPLTLRIGRGPGLLAAFALSGLLHELAISVPVRAGYGLPLLYFLLQGILVLAERALQRARHPLTGWLGRVWTVSTLVIPLPLLFHGPFLEGIVWPLIGMA